MRHLHFSFLALLFSLPLSAVFPQSPIESASQHYQQGIVHWMSGNLDSALAALDSALVFAPDYVEAHVAVGGIHIQRESYEAAQKAYENALNIRPDFAEAHLGIGHVYWFTDPESEHALEAYRKALELQPENANANYHVGKVLSVYQRHEEAVPYLETAIRLDPNLPNPHESLGISYLATGRHDKVPEQWRELKRKGGLPNSLVELNRNLLMTVAEGGILFTNGDSDTFPIWYLQQVENVRPEVRVVNLNLLNAVWYIKVLRDLKQIKIDYDDEYLDHKLKERYWPKPEQVELAGLKWFLTPVAGLKHLRIQDVMLLKILEWNDWEHPIYFAVTVDPRNKLGLDDYMRLEGLAWRLEKEKSAVVAVEQTWQNLKEKYSYVHLQEQRALSDNIFLNYASIFCLLAEALVKQRDFERGTVALGLADSLGVLRDATMNEWAGKLAEGMGKEELASKFHSKAMALKGKKSVTSNQ